jgi:hypothetical protein
MRVTRTKEPLLRERTAAGRAATMFARSSITAVVSVFAAAQMHAQTSEVVTVASRPASRSEPVSPRSMCFRDDMSGRCSNYAVFDVMGVMSTNFWLQELGSSCSRLPAVCSSSGFENGYWAWDLGAMHHLKTRLAAGGQLRIGAGSSSDFRVALEPRGRLWLTRWLTLDAAAGPLLVRQISNSGTSSGVTGEVVLGAADLLGVSIGGDALGSPRRSAVYVGLRTGSYASFAGSLVAGGALVVQRGLRN